MQHTRTPLPHPRHPVSHQAFQIWLVVGIVVTVFLLLYILRYAAS